MTSIQAQPSLEFIPQNFNPLVWRGVKLLLPFWMRSQTSIADIKGNNVEILVDLYRQFQAGKIRFLIAFRHPNADDSINLFHLLSNLVPKTARQQGISLNQPINSHFMYDRGIPLWAGSWVSWLYSNLGGTPIHRGKLDRLGLRAARDLFLNGKFPMAAAPEGGTNGHNEVISPLEPGIAQMGFWCIEDLIKAGRDEQVFIVPVGIKYNYIHPPWQAIENLLTQLEIDTGLSIKNTEKTEEIDLSKEGYLYRRLYRLAQHLLTIIEDFYARFYHSSKILIEKPTSERSPNNFAGELPISNEEFATRLQALLDTALKVAEEYFNLQPKGSVIDRCRRLEQAGWDYIFREDLKNIELLSPLEKGLADRIAEEANLRMWHMRLVESFVAVTGKYVLEKPTAERFAETTVLMWDAIARIKGGKTFPRPRLGKQIVQMTVGNPISVSERWETYQGSRRNAKQAVTDLTKDLQTALESMAIQ